MKFSLIILKYSFVDIIPSEPNSVFYDDPNDVDEVLTSADPEQTKKAIEKTELKINAVKEKVSLLMLIQSTSMLSQIFT